MGSICVKPAKEDPHIRDIPLTDITRKTDSEFERWARGKQLKDETIQKLIDEELDNFAALKLCKEDDLKRLNLKTGQNLLLRDAIRDLRGDKKDEGTGEPQKPKQENPGSRKTNSRLLLQHMNEDGIVVGTILKAMFDFDAQEADDLDFKTDDRMILLEKSDEHGWWRVKHFKSGKEGYIPSTYVAQADDDIKSREWWFNVDRQESNKLLLLPGNPDGTFLVRKCGAKDSFALSMRWLDPEKPNAVGVRHYRIRLMDGGKCYLSASKVFPSVAELIDYYRVTRSDLCCKLVKVCPKEPEIVPFKMIEIAKESISLTQKIGKGNFGEVFQAKWRNQLDVAVKKLLPDAMYPDKFLEEAKTMHKLRHRRLVQLLGVCTQSEPMYIVVEYMVNGCLSDYLVNYGPESIHFMDLMGMAAQIADGMTYLEEHNFIHRDVRAGNMLVGANNIVKVADFGLARLIEDVYTSSNPVFPVKWTSPESIHTHRFTIKSDVWSFGVLLYELLTYGGMPYPGMSNEEVIKKLGEEQYRMTVPSRFHCPNDVNRIMMKCWHNVTSYRPTFSSLHEFFARYKLEVKEGEEVDVAFYGYFSMEDMYE